MKKINISLSAVLLASAILTGCGKENKEQENTSGTVSQKTETSAASVSDTVSESVSSDTETQTASETVAGASANQNTEDTETVGTVNPLTDYAAAALAVGDWPEMWEVTDEQILSDFFLLDKNNENYRSLIVMQCPMNANMSELVIIEADDPQSAADDLKERRKKAQDTDAFYPEDTEKAKNAIVGTTGDYAYYILSADPELSEEALLMKLES